MRLWSIHPSYLDAKGLVASWREALLAQKVLMGETKGYTKHPQLQRFRSHKIKSKDVYNVQNERDDLMAIGAFLNGIFNESKNRSYKFDEEKIKWPFDLKSEDRIPVKHGQLQYEFSWLLSKLKERDPNQFDLLSKQIKKEGEYYVGLEPHPCFMVIEGDMNIESWEKITVGKSPAKKKRKRKTVSTQEEFITTGRITRSQTKPNKKIKDYI